MKQVSARSYCHRSHKIIDAFLCSNQIENKRSESKDMKQLVEDSPMSLIQTVFDSMMMRLLSANTTANQQLQPLWFCTICSFSQIIGMVRVFRVSTNKSSGIYQIRKEWLGYDLAVIAGYDLAIMVFLLLPFAVCLNMSDKPKVRGRLHGQYDK